VVGPGEEVFGRSGGVGVWFDNVRWLVKLR
jgi:hypothetical protein